MADFRSRDEAVALRDAGTVRLRRLTAAALAVATAGCGVVTGLAASSKRTRAMPHSRPARRLAAAVPIVSAPAATVPLRESFAPPSDTQAAPAAPQAASPAPPATPPAPSSAPPAAVSGGS